MNHSYPQSQRLLVGHVIIAHDNVKAANKPKSQKIVMREKHNILQYTVFLFFVMCKSLYINVLITWQWRSDTLYILYYILIHYLITSLRVVYTVYIIYIVYIVYE